MTNEPRQPELHDRVIKRGGDYTFEGYVVCVFTKRRSGALRYVVEDDRGLLLIMSPLQIKLWTPQA